MKISPGSGSDVVQGIDYQIYRTMERSIQLYTDNNLLKIIIEAPKNKIEDINLFFKNHKVIFEQVKKKDEGGQWTAGEMKDITKKFINLYKEYREKSHFSFVTNCGPDKKLTNIKNNIIEMAKTGNFSDIIRDIFPENTKKNTIIEIVKRLDFQFYIYPPSKNDPTNLTSKYHVELGKLIQDCFQVNQNLSEKIINVLYIKIKDMAKEKFSEERRTFRRNDLMKIINKYKNIDIENLNNLEIPSTLKNILKNATFDSLEFETSIEIGKKRFHVDIIGYFKKIELLIYIFDENKSSETIKNLNILKRLIDNYHKGKYILLYLYLKEDIEYNLNISEEYIIRPSEDIKLRSLIKKIQGKDNEH